VAESAKASRQPDSPHGPDENSTRIGRYEVVSQLGRGGFGYVYKAWDPELQCHVAIKVPRWDRVLREGEMNRFREEARTLARIRNHPAIVTVYDIAETAGGIPYAVMEFVQGQSLSSYLKDRPIPLEESLHILLRVAEALQAAHQASIVHRDLKPANVILDATGNVTLVDFGLALHDDLSIEEMGNAVEGTAPYMSPEQIRGENHRIDGQTDVWAFGVVMYRMLTGKYPFRAKNTQELARMIRYREAKPPRQLNPAIPKQVERICLKCLAKLMKDRYQSMPDLINELADAIQQMQRPPETQLSASDLEPLSRYASNPDYDPSGSRPDSRRSGRSTGSGFSNPSQSRPLPVTYKGLRPFDSNDREFFLELLPGPRTRDNIPESIQFWRSRILGDELEPLQVGLIYGPSGCGKSSFVRAGLLPLLPTQINPVYLECTPQDTEGRLVRQIAHRIHSVSSGDSLPDILRQFRRGDHLAPGDRLLIVLDQFEQWLHGVSGFDEQPLTEALRQCDGRSVSCILLIRDDFWMSTSQFMQALEIPIRQGHNALALPLFDERHARRVLVAFGRSFDRLPRSTDDDGFRLKHQQKKFVRSAVKALSRRGKVICVHLAVFAQIAKDTDWTASELNRLGGLKGAGVRYLDELFKTGAGTRLGDDHFAIARSVLQQLLPPAGLEIKGTSRTRGELLEGANAASVTGVFDDTIQWLESDLQLVSVVDSIRGDETASSPGDTAGESYRLSHDFLVSPIREWLDRLQQETRRGRVERRLADLGAAWQATRDSCYLPGVLEFASFLGLASRQARSPYRDFIREARRRVLSRILAVGVVMGLVAAVAGWALNDRLNQAARMRADNYLIASPRNTPACAERLIPWSSRARGLLTTALQSEQSIRKLRASCFLIDQFGPQPQYVEALLASIPQVPTTEYQNLLQSLRGLNPDSIRRLETLGLDLDKTRRVHLSLVLLQGGHPDLAREALRRQNSFERSLFIERFAESGCDVRNCLSAIPDASSSDFTSGLCLAVATMISGEEWLAQDAALRSAALWKFEQLFTSERVPAAVRSAAEFGLRKLGATPTGKRGENRSQDGWASLQLVPDQWVTFVRIPGGQLPSRNISEDILEQLKIDRRSAFDTSSGTVRDFYLCSIPVTRQIFDLYVDGLPAEHPLKTRFGTSGTGETPPEGIPAAGIMWYDAAEFCNWLSRRHGLPEFYQLGNRPARPTLSSSVHRASDVCRIDDPGQSGFRLPFAREWTYAYRANSETITPYSDTLKQPFWDMYSWFRQAALITSGHGVVHARLPNALGIFDMSGNTSQWCNDSFEDYYWKRFGGHVLSSEGGLLPGVFARTVVGMQHGNESIRLAINPAPDGSFPLPLKQDREGTAAGPSRN
jgi:serine/threonine protein kinase/formylglycine-generating enzyme required for sulfatase activity